MKVAVRTEIDEEASVVRDLKVSVECREEGVV